MTKLKFFALACLGVILNSKAMAACNDSYSVTHNTITINWDISSCNNLKNGGEIFEICWKGGPNVFSACLTHSAKFNQSSGSHTITGLQANGVYGVKTSYRRKARWDELSRRTITTNAAPAAQLQFNVSPPEAGGCRTFTWANLPAIQPGINRGIEIEKRAWGIGGFYTFFSSKEITTLGLTGTEQVCGFKPSFRYKAYVRDGALGTGSQVTPGVTFF